MQVGQVISEVVCRQCPRGTVQLWGGGLGMQHGLKSVHR